MEYRRGWSHEVSELFSAKGDRLSHCAKSVPSTHKKVPPFVQAQKYLRLGSNRRPMDIFSDLW